MRRTLTNSLAAVVIAVGALFLATTSGRAQAGGGLGTEAQQYCCNGASCNCCGAHSATCDSTGCFCN